MKQKEKINPTPSELAILQLLWEYGPSTVRFIHDKLSEEKEVVYTTTLKTMQVMCERGMLFREIIGRKHIYQASIEKDETQNALLDRFLNRAFGGSALKLVMKALGNYDTSEKEIEVLKSYIQSLEKNNEK